MNEQEKRKANMEAAKLLGKDENYALHIATTGSVMLVSFDGPRQWVGTFSLFANPADCLDVVKKLGEEHDIAITFYDGPEKWIAEAVSVINNFNSIHDTYEEAVAAAVLGLAK